jgi:Spy/CpxP family protein refolding chaperone
MMGEKQRRIQHRLLALMCVAAALVACQKATNPNDELSSPSMETQDPQKLRERLNKLLYWQIADELKLTPNEEKSLVALLDRYQQAKEKELTTRDELLKKIEVEATVEAASVGPAYEKNQKALSELETQHVADLRKLLGDKRFVSFLKIRKSLHEKLLKAVQEEQH